MTLRPSLSRVHLNYMDDRARITDEIARIKKALLLKGFPFGPEPSPSIEDVSAHCHWDGIVGHPVDVEITVSVWNMNCPS